MIKVLKGLSWATGAQMLALFSGLLFSVFVARSLGPEGMGVWAFYLSLIYILGPLSMWSMGYVVQREIVTTTINNPSLVRSALITRFFFGAVTSVIFLITIILLGRDVEEIRNIGIWFALIPVLGVFAVVRSGLESLKLWQFVFFIAFTSIAVLIMGGVLTFFMGWGLKGFMWSKVAEVVTLSLVAMFFLNKLVTPSSGNELRSVPNMIKAGAMLTVTLTLGAAYSRIDQILIATLLDEKILGIYAIAIQLLGAWWALGNIIVIFLQPVILSNAQEPEKLKTILEGAFSIAVLFGVAAIICNVVFGKLAISILYGEAFESVYGILICLSPAIMLLPMLGIRSSYMIGKKRDNLFLVMTLIGLAVTLAGNFLLLPKFGLWGAVISLNLCYFVVAILANFMFPSFRFIGRMMIGAVFMPFSQKRRAAIRGLLIELGR